jgi:predicted DNA binding CopG/RHH family protein
MSKGTPIRNIRVPDDLWDSARAKAAARGENLSQVLRRALEEYAKEPDEPTN